MKMTEISFHDELCRLAAAI
ncbi:protein YrbN [Pantoea agglomerans]|nr:protein YrbN [Pantoea agglomerans]NEG99491.1 protein YrbN [Pantoea agglomerans]NEH02470.1 protein YrbN [Pantoea agglomerans]NEH14650.1 protein YrbN [Pantoea agglomerans]